MKPLVKGILYITGFSCPPEEITRVLNVEPSRSWLAGDLIGPTVRAFESNGWQLDSQLTDETDPEVHLRELLRRIPDQTVQHLRKATTEWNLQFSIVVEMQDETPPFNLGVDTLQLVASLGASVDVDLYVTGDDEEAPTRPDPERPFGGRIGLITKR